MRLSLMTATLVASLALAGAAHAQEAHAGHEAHAPQEGQYSASLTRLITSAADGECPADLMAADLLSACNEQIASIGPALQSLGPIRGHGLCQRRGRGRGPRRDL